MRQTTTAGGRAAVGNGRTGRVAGLLGAAWAVTAYVVFLGVLGYSVGFFAGVRVPKGIDDGALAPVGGAVAVDLLLLLLFAAQHTVMARQGFKRRSTRVVPASVERATFVLAADLALVLLFWLWRPVDAVVWSVPGPMRFLVWAVYVAGWAVALRSTFLISHSDLFGLRQAWHHARGRSYASPPFIERGMYRRVRHPLMAGFVVVFWAAPTMTVGHLVFAAAATGYILVGIALEERDLVRTLGTPYAEYRSRVPALVPRVRWRRHPAAGRTGDVGPSLGSGQR